jgi:hypothetical protein
MIWDISEHIGNPQEVARLMEHTGAIGLLHFIHPTFGKRVLYIVVHRGDDSI